MIKPIINLYLWLEKLWFRFPEKLRYLLVGGFNTVFAYSLLVLLDFLFTQLNRGSGWGCSKEVVANIALVFQYIITVNVSFMTMRYYVFQSHGNWKKEWLKAWSVYIFIYATNAPIMTFLLYIFNLGVWQAQAIYLIFSTIVTFLLHKYYSFRKN